MARIRKLTPAILKRIIAEEKQKLRQKRRRTNKRKKRSKLRERNEITDIKLLKLIRKEEIKAAMKFKKLYEVKTKLKKKIIRDI